MRKKYDISFTKAVASGNDFVIIDNKNGALDERKFDYSEIARDLCRRNLAIGADGILVLESSKKADFRMRVINPDGSEAEMCGNGARCSALYAAVNGWGKDLSFETGAGILRAEVNADKVKIRMSDPKNIKLGITIGLGKSLVNAHHVNSGVPHTVLIVEDIENYPVEETGRKVRQHPIFAPDGTNVNFIGNVTKTGAAIRTYERGVEDETLACGTGTVASAVVLGLLGYVEPPVVMHTKSGEDLTVYFRKAGEKVTEVYLEGTADIVYEGRI